MTTNSTTPSSNVRENADFASGTIRLRPHHKTGIFVDHTTLATAYAANDQKLYLNFPTLIKTFSTHTDLRHVNYYFRTIYNIDDYIENEKATSSVTALRFEGVNVRLDTYHRQETDLDESDQKTKTPPRSLIGMVTDIMIAAPILDHFIIICDSGTLSPTLEYLRSQGKIITVIYNNSSHDYTATRTRRLANHTLPLNTLIDRFPRARQQKQS